MRRTASMAAILSLSAAPVLAAPGNIVTDMPATGSLVQQVLGDLGEVRVLLPDGASVHHYQMRPSDAQALQSADLLVWVGPELTPWLGRAADSLSTGATQLRLLQAEGTYRQDFAAEHAHDDHDDHDDHGDEYGHDDHDHEDHGHQDHGHDDDHTHDDDHDGHDHAPAHDGDHGEDHGHSHDGTDPHAWLDPANAAPWLEAIADALAAHDPENAAIYAANAQAAAADIAALQNELGSQLAPFAEDSFVVFHDAYGYFTNRFGLRPAIAVSLGDASTPSAARLGQVRARIAQSGARCAFPEYAHDAGLIETAIEGSGARLGGVLDPQGGGIAADRGQYQLILRGMADTIADCLKAD
ncbi:MAG: zinc ABC transporter substrate-binding protein [Paracoccus sp. (in: a-proteobacteria)]|uniref:zinc ABC transporter substrate-binding protein n=1 Tax=Paracoccus sp. TaxID=267 RepID=UPI00391D2F49